MNRLVRPKRFYDVLYDLVFRVLQEPVNGVHHECDEGFTLLLLKKSLNQRERNTRETERVDKCETGRNVSPICFDGLKKRANLFVEPAGLCPYLEMRRNRDGIQFLLEVLDAIRALVNEPENELTAQRSAMIGSHI